MSLNPRQREAVEHGNGPLLILAAAGSGKTRALVHRIARLLDEGHARPDEVLAVTFTNKAARELVDRCISAAGAPARSVWAGTFHGIGARILRRHAEVLGYPPTFAIFDADDQKKLLKDIVEEANLDETLFPPEAVRAYIEAAKNEGRSAESSGESRGDPISAKMAALYSVYQRRLEKMAAMDFGDLVLGVLRLFEREPQLLARYRERFRYVLVDEYQDTNHAQYLMVSSFAAGHGNICVVGDDDQSIYGWRGASLRNILEFERDFPGAHVIRLDQNYRSTGTIIRAAGAVIAHNRSRMEKTIWTENEDGNKIRVYTAEDERDEARFIIDKLLALGTRRRDAAIFYRTNAQSRAIEESLVRARIPYVIVGTTRFYERREVKDLLAYLRFVLNPADDLSLARIINVPARGIGRTTWETLVARAVRDGGPVWPSLETAAPALKSAARVRIEGFRRMVEVWQRRDASSGVTPLLESIIRDTGYATYLSQLPGEEVTGRLENVRELITVAQTFDESPPDEDPEAPTNPLARFLEQLALASDVDGYEARENAVTLMTIHNAKGLEFDHVFIAGMEEGLFPHARSTNGDERGIEEERRLCYVGITRARHELTLLRAVRRHVFGATQFNLPSRFLDEIPHDLLVHSAAAMPVHGRGTTYVREEASDSDIERPVYGTQSGTYTPGMKVVHPMFGVGTVKKCDASGEDEKIVVQFQRAGIKKLVARFAKLQIV
jgi:DNA helicase-2/ATP-dependent DNA helicase PcrA